MAQQKLPQHGEDLNKQTSPLVAGPEKSGDQTSSGPSGHRTQF